MAWNDVDENGNRVYPNAVDPAPYQLPNGDWFAPDRQAAIGMGLKVRPDGTIANADYQSYQSGMQNWFDTQQKGDDPWSTILPALLAGATGAAAFSGAGVVGGAEGAAGGATGGFGVNSPYWSMLAEGGAPVTDAAATGAGTVGGTSSLPSWATNYISSIGSPEWLAQRAASTGVSQLANSGGSAAGDALGNWGGQELANGSLAGINAATDGGGGTGWLDSLLTPKNLLSAGLQLGGAALNANAVGRASDAQQQALAQANAQQLAMYNQTRADQEPFRQAGLGVLPRLTAGLAPGGELTRKFTTADRDADPVYQSGLQFGLTEGEKGINARAIGSGMYDSGATLKALTKFGNDYGSTKANDSYNRFTADQTGIYNKLAGTAGFGQTATNQVQAANTNYGNTTANLAADAGNSRAAGIVGGANAWGNALSGIGNTVTGTSSDRILKALLGSGYYGLGA